MLPQDVPRERLPSEIFIQTGHSREISRLAISPDGQFLASASYDGTVKLWEMAGRREIYTFLGHDSIINAVTFTPDGKFLVTAGAEPDKSLHVVERQTGRSVRRLTGHPGGVSSVAVLPDGRRAISVGEKGAVIVWDMDAGALLQHWTFDITWITQIAVAPEGRRAVIGAGNGRILLISLDDGSLIREYPKQEWMIAGLAFDPQGRFFVSAAGGMLGQQRPVVAQWSLDSTEPLRVFDGPEGTVLDLAISANGSLVAAAASDTVMGTFGAYTGSQNAVWIWETGTGNLVRRWDQSPRRELALDRAVSAVAFTPDGAEVAFATKDHRIARRAIGADEKTIARFDGRSYGHRLLAILPDAVGTSTSILDSSVARKRRSSGATQSSTQLHGVQRVGRWNLRTGVREQVQDLHNSSILALSPGADGELLSIAILSGLAPHDPEIKLPPECEDARAEACVRWLHSHQGYSEGKVREVTEVPDGTARRIDFAWNPRPEEPFFYFPPLGERPLALSGSKKRVALSIQVSPNPPGKPVAAEKVLAVPEEDIVVYEREGTERRVIAVLRSPGPVEALAFSRDEISLLVGVCEPVDADKRDCNRARLHKVDVASGRWTAAQVVTLGIKTIALSPDGRFAVTTGDFGVGAWQVSDLKLAAVLQEEHRPIRRSRAAAWSADQNRLAVASYGRAIRIWNTQTLHVDRLITGFEGNVDAMAWTPDGKHLLALSDDGAVRIWEPLNGKLIATMTEFDDGEWITVIPEGYFVGSRDGDRQLNVRYGDRVYGMDQFYDLFYRPDIVERKLAGEPIGELISLTIEDALQRPPPRVAIRVSDTGNGEMVRVKATASTTGGGVGDVRVFHNGKLIASEGDLERKVSAAPLDVLPPAEQNARGLRVIMKSSRAARARRTQGAEERWREVEVRLAPGQNRVWATGFNGDDSLQSRPVSVDLPARPPAAPRVFVMAIGVDRYIASGLFPELKYAAKDARDFANQVRERAGRLFPGAPVNVSVLTDAQASLAGVEAELERLRKVLVPGDLFVWFIASHGVLDADASYNVVLHDAELSRPESGVLSTARLLDWLKRLPVLDQILVLDTCHAGGLDSVVRGLYDARIAVLARSMGLHILASASEKESAIDGYRNNGLFTHSVLRGMADPAADVNADRRLSVTELGRFSQQLTRAIAREIRARQNPMVFHFGRDIHLSEFYP